MFIFPSAQNGADFVTIHFYLMRFTNSDIMPTYVMQFFNTMITFLKHERNPSFAQKNLGILAKFYGYFVGQA